MEFRKMVRMTLYVRQQKRSVSPYHLSKFHIFVLKNRLLDSVGEGRGGMIGENNIETCILPHVK